MTQRHGPKVCVFAAPLLLYPKDAVSGLVNAETTDPSGPATHTRASRSSLRGGNPICFRFFVGFAGCMCMLVEQQMRPVLAAVTCLLAPPIRKLP